jgi:hypothetical protein
MIELFSSWWAMTSAYFAAPFSLLTGNVQLLTVLPTVGIPLLVLGVVIAVVQREKKARWLAIPFVLAALTPVIISLGNDILGWFGLLFVLVAGGVGLLIWTGVVASDSTKRLPIWLIGFGLISFVAYCALVAIALIWGV